MKFDVVIGNPPYQETNGGGTGSGANSIYEEFILNAIKLNPLLVCMITKSSWFNGSGYKDFRKKFLEDNHIQCIVDYTNSEEVFSGMDGIAGGVSYFLWNKNYNGLCRLENHNRSKISTADISTNTDIIIRYPELNTIIEKVTNANNFQNMTSMISPQTPFGFNTNAIDFANVVETDSCNIRLIGSRGRDGWVSEDDISKNLDWLPLYKVLINQAMSGGCKTDNNGMSQVLTKPFTIKPNEICTQTYLVAGLSYDIQICQNIETYLSTKFVRILMLATLASKSINPETFRYVPMQDFSHPWTDKMLYEKYNLSEEEIAYIEQTIKPMN